MKFVIQRTARFRDSRQRSDWKNRKRIFILIGVSEEDNTEIADKMIKN